MDVAGWLKSVGANPKAAWLVFCAAFIMLWSVILFCGFAVVRGKNVHIDGWGFTVGVEDPRPIIEGTDGEKEKRVAIKK